MKAGLVEMALQPLKEIASRGIPVYLVPGNHERSKIPFGLLSSHPGLFVFDRPRTFVQETKGRRVAFAGFPFQRDWIRKNFKGLLTQTAWRKANADINMLCIHQCVEGATVGPSGYTFRSGQDVIRASDLTGDWCAILAGHIHKAQVLTQDLLGRRLPSKVFYPGSVERTSFAERNESKGFFILEVDLGPHGGRLAGWKFSELPARPMFTLALEVRAPRAVDSICRLREQLSSIPRNSVVRINVRVPGLLDRKVLWSEIMGFGIPPTMSLRVRWIEQGRSPEAGSTGETAA